MTTPHRIELIMCGRYEEAFASGILSPGHLVKMDSDGKYLKHSTKGERVTPIIALESALNGGAITTAYAVGDVVFSRIAQRGDVFLGRLPANAAAVSKFDKLISNGDGTFVKSHGFGLLYNSVVNSAEHENTTDAANFDKYYDIPANYLAVGDKLRIRGQVTVIDNNSTDTLTLLLTLGGVTVAATAAVDVADGDVGHFDAEVTIRTIGATGTFQATGTQGLGVPGTVTAKPFVTAGSALDTTAAVRVAVNADWSVAHADNEALLSQLSVELVRAGDCGPMVEAIEAVDNSATAAEAFIRLRVL